MWSSFIFSTDVWARLPLGVMICTLRQAARATEPLLPGARGSTQVRGRTWVGEVIIFDLEEQPARCPG